MAANDEIEELIAEITGGGKKLILSAQECARIEGRVKALSETISKGTGGGEKDRKAAAKRHGQPLLKLAQACLEFESSSSAKESAANAEDVRLVIYRAACLSAKALATLADMLDLGRLAMEKILYHAVARGAQLQQHDEVETLTRLLGNVISSSLSNKATAASSRTGGRAGGKENDEMMMSSDEEEEEEGDDWGTAAKAAEARHLQQRQQQQQRSRKGGAVAVIPVACSNKKGGRNQSNSKKREEEGFGFGPPPLDCDVTLAKLVVGAVVNGIRSLVESATEGRIPQGLKAIGQECLAWLQVFMSKGQEKEKELAGQYADRLYRAFWKVAGNMEKEEGSASIEKAIRLRSLCLRLSVAFKAPTLVPFISNLWRTGIWYEKKASEVALSVGLSLLNSILTLYEDASEALVLPTGSQWALSVEILDWMRHFSSLCLKAQQPDRALSFLTKASQSLSCPTERKHAPDIIQGGTNGKKASKSKSSSAAAAAAITTSKKHKEDAAAAITTSKKHKEDGVIDDRRLALAHVTLRLHMIVIGLSKAGAAPPGEAEKEEQGLIQALVLLAWIPESQVLEHRLHLTRTWRALAKLPTVMSLSSLIPDKASPSTVSTVLLGFLSLANLSHLLLDSSPSSSSLSSQTTKTPSSSPSSAADIPEVSLRATLSEALLRAGIILTTCLGQSKHHQACLDVTLGAMAPIKLPLWLLQEDDTAASPDSKRGGDLAHLAMLCLYHAEASVVPGSSLSRRLGASWFSLGRILSDQGSPLAGLAPMARGCGLLRRDLTALDSSSAAAAYIEACKQSQLDLRLATLATALSEIGMGSWAKKIACQALAFSPAVLAGQPPQRNLIRKLVQCMSVSQTLDKEGLASCSAKNGAPAWALEVIEKETDPSSASSSSSSRKSLPPPALCLTIPSLEQRAVVAKMEMSAYLSLLHASLKDLSRRDENEVKVIIEAHRCCRKEGGVSDLWAAIEGARIARVLIRSGQEKAAALGEGSAAEWVNRIEILLQQVQDSISISKRKAIDHYEVAVSECMIGMMVAEAKKCQKAAEAMTRALQAWRLLCQPTDSSNGNFALDPQLTRQCFEAMADHLAGDGPSLKQVHMFETAMYVSRHYISNASTSRQDCFMSYFLSVLFSRLGFVDIGALYLKQAEEALGSTKALPPLVIAVRCIAKMLVEPKPTGDSTISSSSLTSLIADLGSSRQGHVRGGAACTVRSLACLIEADRAFSCGELPAALHTLRSLAATCQGLEPPPADRLSSSDAWDSRLSSGASKEEDGENGDDAVAMEEGKVEVEVAVVQDLSGKSNSSPSMEKQHEEFLPYVLAGGLRSTWCLPECLLRMAEVWEAMGVAGKASGYYNKVAVVASRWGASTLARKAMTGKARVKGEEAAVVVASEHKPQPSLLVNGAVVVDGMMEEVQMLIGDGDSQRQEGELAKALESYTSAESRRKELLTLGPLTLLQEKEGRPSSSSSLTTIRRWRRLAAAVAWRQAWTTWLDKGMMSKKGKGSASAWEHLRLTTDKSLLAVIEGEDTVVFEDKIEACFRLARTRAAADGDGCSSLEVIQALKQAWSLVRESRCPRLIREIGRALVAMEGLGMGQEAALTLGSTIALGFGNAVRLSGGGSGLSEVLPKGWTVVSIALVPGEEGKGDKGGDSLLIGRIEGKGGNMVGHVQEVEALREIMNEMDNIMEGNIATLRGRSAEEVAAWGKKEKAAWWDERGSLDHRLGSLLIQLESLLGPWCWLLCGQAEDSAMIDLIEAATEALGPWEGPDVIGRSAVKAFLSSGLLAGSRSSSQEEWRKELADLLEVSVKGKKLPTKQQVDEALNLIAQAFESKEAEIGTTDDKVEVIVQQKHKKEEADNLCRNSSKLTVADLRKELAQRSLPTAGVKATLLARLKDSIRGEMEEETESARDAGPNSVETVILSSSLSSSSSRIRGSSPSSSSSSQGRRGGSKERRSNSGEDQDGEGAAATAMNRHPVILVLDESLQRLPWECLEILKGHPVSRCPSLEYIEAALRRYSSISWSFSAAPAAASSVKGKKATGRGKGRAKPAVAGASNTADFESGGESALGFNDEGIILVKSSPGYYVLDPESNLAQTRETLQPTISRCQEAVGWEGLIGQAPKEYLLKAKLAASSVFLYCGHGSGETFLPREEVAGLPSAPLAILMGCSSGRLKAHGPFEPTGMALSYLGAGSPAVVGNLWDVTDRDIDRFSLSLLEDLFLVNSEGEEVGHRQQQSIPLLQAVAKAREACKLPYLVGAAPVVYGLPVQVIRESRSST